MNKKNNIDNILSKMTLEQKIAQVLCWNVTETKTEDIKRRFDNLPLGCVFYGHMTGDEYREKKNTIEDICEIPVIACADLVNGAGCRIHPPNGGVLFPWQMACGAANDEGLVEKMGEAIAIEGREFGVHWTLAPIVDLSINPLNSMMGTRTFGEKPEHVIKMAKAFIRGVQKNGCMAATAKHFPGDGVDDRDSHVCTSVNTYTREEWENSFGIIWRSMIDSGVLSVMSGHIGLPFIDGGIKAYMGPTPATLSKKLQIDFLRKELEFEGVIVSDAAPMAGFTSHAKESERAWRTIEAGTDVYLWADVENDPRWMKEAVIDGKLSEERLNDAVRRVLLLKEQVGLLDKRDVPKATKEQKGKYVEYGEEIAKRSITVIRNEENSLPVQLKSAAKVLTVTWMFGRGLRGKMEDLKVIDSELENRGFEVRHIVNPTGNQIVEMAPQFDAVFMNIFVPPRYGTLRMDSEFANTMWGSFWLDHPCVIFTSFGDPYKIHEMPTVPNMINAYSDTPSTQRAAVKVWFGEEKAYGKSPLSLPGFFDIEI